MIYNEKYWAEVAEVAAHIPEKSEIPTPHNAVSGARVQHGIFRVIPHSGDRAFRRQIQDGMGLSQGRIKHTDLAGKRPQQIQVPAVQFQHTPRLLRTGIGRPADQFSAEQVDPGKSLLPINKRQLPARKVLRSGRYVSEINFRNSPALRNIIE